VSLTLEGLSFGRRCIPLTPSLHCHFRSQPLRSLFGHQYWELSLAKSFGLRIQHSHILHLVATHLVDIAAPNLTRFQLSEFCTPQGPPLISQVYPLFTPLTCPTTLILYHTPNLNGNTNYNRITTLSLTITLETYAHVRDMLSVFTSLDTLVLNLGVRQIPVSPYAPIHQAMIRLPCLQRLHLRGTALPPPF
jgi:hypothetical protein